MCLSRLGGPGTARLRQNRKRIPQNDHDTRLPSRDNETEPGIGGSGESEPHDLQRIDER
jgi:hypothetical protein